MYSPAVIDRREHTLLQALGPTLGITKLRRRPVEDCWALRDRLASARDAKGTPLRALTTEEQQFVLHEGLLAQIDYRYWSERYATVVKDTAEAEPLTPRWASQDLFLARIAALEDERYGRHPDGILVNVLKARQLGISTESQAMLAHRLTTSKSMRGIVAGDVPEQSSYLLGMTETILEHLPWWLHPGTAAPTNVGAIITMTTKTSLRVGAGKSQRGGLQDKGGTKGNIGRGKTFSLAHISEVSTWERPEQLFDGLLPGIPARPRTFCVFESTAKGRHDPWHTHWESTGRGTTRFVNVFIPWYIEPDKYWLPVPDGWAPSALATQHAEAVERDSGQWCLGKTIRLSREQLCWYERTRADFDERNELYKFLEEYPATPAESFQHSGRTIFKPKTLERLKAQERRPQALLHIESRASIALLGEPERQETRRARARDAAAEDPPA